MGVPAFFRWLSVSCPQIVKTAVEDLDARPGTVDNEYKNPIIDNLYLDMNGIIHPCTHPQGQNDEIPVPKNREDMWRNIREYVDMIVNIVNPQKLVFFAIDGVAPRAKMNQQRGRRFKSANDIYKGVLRKKRLSDLWRREGIELPETFSKDTHWDHNVITPGTDFMSEVSLVIRVRFFI